MNKFSSSQGHDSTGLVFPGVVPLLRRLQVDVTQLQEKYQGEALAETTETPLIGSIGYFKIQLFEPLTLT